MKNNITELVFILDRSGAPMAADRSEAVESDRAKRSR